MNKYLHQIKNHQQKNGGFLSAEGQPSSLYSAFILSCLNRFCDTKESEEIKKGIVRFLLSQKNDEWRFKGNTGENFYILSSLAEYDQDLFDGTALAKILARIISLESKEGGPYYSEPEGDRTENKKIDPVANASIARFLSFLGVELPGLSSFQSNIESEGKIIKAFRLSFTPEISSVMALAEKRSGTDSLPRHGLSKSVSSDVLEQKIANKIIKIAEKRFSALSSDLRDFAMRGIQKTMKANRDKQMSLMAYYTKQALGKKAHKISNGLIAEMGLANIFFWTAFIIYDDFWDEDEAADPRILPSANLYARSYVDFFNAVLPEKTGFRAFFHSLMDELDGANTWETLHCRTEVNGSTFSIPKKLPDYGKYDFKYRPASGHILGPVAILLLLGYRLNSPEVKNLISYFRNYLIAMQLNDDAHDWEEDMARGHLSTVVVLLLSDLKASGWRKPTIDLVSDLYELKKVFWFTTMKKYAKITLSYAQASRKALLSLDILEDSAPLLRFVTLTENAALQAERENETSEAFLKEYNAALWKK